LNRCRGLCRPLPNHSATPPQRVVYRRPHESPPVRCRERVSFVRRRWQSDGPARSAVCLQPLTRSRTGHIIGGVAQKPPFRVSPPAGQAPGDEMPLSGTTGQHGGRCCSQAPFWRSRVAVAVVVIIQAGRDGTCSGWYRAEDRCARQRSASCGTLFEQIRMPTRRVRGRGVAGHGDGWGRTRRDAGRMRTRI
jgi:hypothetical protein